MEVKDFLDLHGPTVLTLFGLVPNKETKKGVAISKGDLLFIEYVISNDQSVKNIVELGTWAGVTSLYFGMCAKLRGGVVHTFDIDDNRMDEVKRNWLDNMFFCKENVLALNGNVINLIKNPTALTFFDNGDKISEVNMYAEHIPIGCGFFVHDWNKEIRLANIEATLKRCGFVQQYEQEAVMLNTHCRYFKRQELTGPIG